MTVNLVEFLRARLDEDRNAAEEAMKRTTTTRRFVSGRWVEYKVEPPEWRRSAWSFERVLAETEAKRIVVDAYARWQARADAGEELSAFERGTLAGLYSACRILAETYPDHPNYPMERRP